MNERYEIRGIIARGGAATVHLGWDVLMNRAVAIKRTDGAGGVDALAHEAAVLRRIEHPNIVSLLDSGQDDKGAFIVMELVGGKTLEERVAECPLDAAEFEQLATQTLDGLSASHARNVVHLDLKPENIMMDRDAAGRLNVKILDFGAAREASSSDLAVKTNDGPVMGSLFFMAPERFERAPGDVWSDLYSLGCVFYYALAGQPPFQGGTGPEVMVAHLRHQFTPLAELRPELPTFIPSWIEWLLSRRPEERPASVLIALTAFRERRSGD